MRLNLCLGYLNRILMPSVLLIIAIINMEYQPNPTFNPKVPILNLNQTRWQLRSKLRWDDNLSDKATTILFWKRNLQRKLNSLKLIINHKIIILRKKRKKYMKTTKLDQDKVRYELFLFSSPKIRKYILILLKFDILKVKIYKKTESHEFIYENDLLLYSLIQLLLDSFYWFSSFSLMYFYFKMEFSWILFLLIV